MRNNNWLLLGQLSIQNNVSRIARFCPFDSNQLKFWSTELQYPTLTIGEMPDASHYCVCPRNCPTKITTDYFSLKSSGHKKMKRFLTFLQIKNYFPTTSWILINQFQPSTSLQSILKTFFYLSIFFGVNQVPLQRQPNRQKITFVFIPG